MDVYTLWEKVDPSGDVSEVTLIQGTVLPDWEGPGHQLIATFLASSPADACRQRNEFFGWEPYKPME